MCHSLEAGDPAIREHKAGRGGLSLSESRGPVAYICAPVPYVALYA